MTSTKKKCELSLKYCPFSFWCRVAADTEYGNYERMTAIDYIIDRLLTTRKARSQTLFSARRAKRVLSILYSTNGDMRDFLSHESVVEFVEMVKKEFMND